MAELTIFSTPKPFDDPFFAAIQGNAIRSWLALGDEVEVILVGDEPGLAEAAKGLGVTHLVDVECNQWGTPLVRSLFAQAREHSESPLLAIVNADIILLPDFLQAVRAVSKRLERFLLVGRRWGLDIAEPLPFDDEWRERLRARVERQGVLHPIFSIDYFVFPREQYREMPEFVIGRPQWDNWMIYQARRQGWTVVDATPSVTAIHQNHDYRHLPGGKPPHGLEEGKRNRRLAGGERAKYILMDAQVELVDGRLRRPRPSMARGLRALERGLLKAHLFGLEWQMLRLVRRLRVAASEPMPEGWVAGGLRRSAPAKGAQGKAEG